jgi:opacity protein-like surface antigen
MRRRAVILATALALGVPAAGEAQELADFDYENLSLRGIGLEVGYLWPNRVEPTVSYGARADLGYLGPGLRITPSITYWSSRMEAGEVAELEQRLEQLVAREQPPGSPPPTITLGPIDRSDVALALDGHVVWRVPFGLLTYAGAGASVHVLNGACSSIDDTFIEDLLDAVSAGFGLHAGIEYPVIDGMRLYAVGRFDLLEDLRYAALRGGVQFHFGGPAEGEVAP